MSQAAMEQTAEDPGGAEGAPGPDPDTVTLVAPNADRVTPRTWTFTRSDGSFPSWAWR